MTGRPILFNGPMVRAILDGRKTQTRRVLKAPPPYDAGDDIDVPVATGLIAPQTQPSDRLWVREAWSDVNNHGAPSIAHQADGNLVDLMDDPSFLTPDGCFDYGAPRLRFGKAKRALPFANWANDLLSGIEGKWRPSIHMPRWASRLTLVVTDVRVQRLQDISEADAIAEGMIPRPARDTFGRDYTGWNSEWPAEANTPEDAHRHSLRTARFAFGNLWNATYGPEAWDANPWVTAITFETHHCNIDQMGESA